MALTRFLTFLFILISNESTSSIRSLSKVNIEIQKSKSELSSHKKNLKKLRNEILSLRNSVTGETNKFSKIVSIKTNLKNEVSSLKKNLKEIQIELEKETSVVKKIFAGLILTENTDEEVDYRFMTLKSLKDKENSLKIKREAIKSMLEKIKEMDSQINEYDFIEVDLISNIEKMHNREKELSRRAEVVDESIRTSSSGLKALSRQKNKIILNNKKKRKAQRLAEEKKRLQEKRMQEQEHDRQKAKFAQEFDLPLDSFERIAKDKSGGLSLFVNSGRKIQSPQDGEILYTGKLSTYGNVIVIKHKNDYQSVILGEIISGVSKAQIVRKGETIGKIIENNGDEKRLYYELRNKNKNISYSDVFKNISI